MTMSMCRRPCAKVSQCPPAISDMFVRRAAVSSRDTRAVAAEKLHLPKCRLAKTQREFACRAALSWNASATDRQ